MTTRSPAVSVVIVNWNRLALLRACMQSLARQTFRDFEVVVVDNGSSDGSIAWLRENLATVAPWTRLIENTSNLGFCAANNQGIAASSAPWVALLNNDAEAEPGWLASLVDLGERHPEAGMVASKILVWEDPTRIDKCGHLIYPDGQNRGRGTGQIDHGQFDAEEEVLWPDGCAALYRRAMLEEIGGFDEDFFAYADDAELGLRARIAGWTAWYAPGAVVRHHRGATLGVQSARRIMLIERNRILLAAKLFPWTLLWRNGAYLLARLVAGLWIAATHPPQSQGELRRFSGLTGKLTVAKGLLWGWLSSIPLLPTIFAKRSRIRRRLSSSQTCDLLKRYRISLRELLQESN